MKSIHIFTGIILFLCAACGQGQVEQEDVAASEYADIPNDTVVTGEFVDTEKWINQYIRAHPDIAFYYMPSDTGRFKTVDGNYTVVVDNVEVVADRDEVYKYFRLKYGERMREMAEFNSGITQEAEPEPGYPSYLAKVDSLVEVDTTLKATVFVELIIDETGEIDNARVVDGLYGQDWDSEVESEVLNAVMSLDIPWKPALKNGEPTSMRIEIPVDIGQG